MPQQSPGTSELDARLAEIDRRLQEIQSGLEPELTVPPAPDVSPAPDSGDSAAPQSSGPPAPEPGPPPSPALSLESPATALRPSPRQGPLAALLARPPRRRPQSSGEEIAELVRMHSGLLDALGELVRLLRPPTQGAGVQVPGPPAAILTAGPFADTGQVEAFVVDVAALEPVREATLIGYEGTDRALIEVQLAEPSG